MDANEQLKTKDQLIKSIKEWVKIDNDIRALKKRSFFSRKRKEGNI